MACRRRCTYYDIRGRTWERQAYIKARPVAGDLDLGERVPRTACALDLPPLPEPGRHQRHQGPQAADRAADARDGGDQARDVKIGHGGIRDIEFVIQFLQLLNGGDLPDAADRQHPGGHGPAGAVRLPDQPGAGAAGARTTTSSAGSSTACRSCSTCKRTCMPADDDELRKLALRMGYADARRSGPAAGGVSWPTTANKTTSNRKILDHLLHDAFGDDDQTEAEVGPGARPRPAAGADRAEVLGKYHFRDVKQAYQNLMALARGEDPLPLHAALPAFPGGRSPRSCSRRSAATADPDAALVNLDKVSDSLGGKGVLWELFSFNPPSLRLYVELCAYSPYLSGILTSNPGMIDGLMDSLVLDKLPVARASAADARPSCAGRRRTSTRSCTASRTTSSFAWAFATCWARRTCRPRPARCRTSPRSAWRRSPRRSTQKLAAKFGRPRIGDGPRAGEPCDMVDSGPGQVRRPGDELPQRPGHRLPLRGRRADGLRLRPRPAQRHLQPALLQRAGPADHQDGQPLERLWQAVRGGRPAAPHRQERLAGHVLAGVRPLFRPRVGAALGAAGAVQGAAGLRLAAGGAGGRGGRAPRRLRPPLAPQRRRRNPPHETPPGGNGRAPAT